MQRYKIAKGHKLAYIPQLSYSVSHRLTCRNPSHSNQTAVDFSQILKGEPHFSLGQVVLYL